MERQVYSSGPLAIVEVLGSTAQSDVSTVEKVQRGLQAERNG